MNETQTQRTKQTNTRSRLYHFCLLLLFVEASIIYQYNNPIKVTLEEDGTQIDSDDSLMACVGKTLVVLNGNEQWRDLDGHSNFPIKR